MKKKVILTGIQSTGKIHLGNYFGAIEPILRLSNGKNAESILFIADMHSLTSIKDGGVRRHNVHLALASMLAFGFDPSKNILFKQSDVPQTCELSFYLSCFTPFPMLANAHSFKERSENLANVNVGLFTYPVLMASDILLYNADIVPVGKDQKQHLEIARDIATKFNGVYKDKILTVPESFVLESQMIVPGIDGRKMSKSYNNYICPFDDERKLRRAVNSIVTSSSGISDPKDPDACSVYKIYSLFASDIEKVEMRHRYQEGVAYSVVKSELFDIIMKYFEISRNEYFKICNDIPYLESILKVGKEKAEAIANKNLSIIKSKLGF